MPQWTKTRIAPERLQSWVQFIFSFYIKKPQGGTGKQASSYRSVCSNQQVVRGKKKKDSLFQLFLQVILFQVASEVTLGT